MKFTRIAIFIALTLLLSSCGAAQVLTPVMTPAIEASVPLPASEAGKPLPTAEPETEPDPTSAPTSAQQTVDPAETEIKLFLNGNRLVLTTPPMLADGVVLVPVAEVCASFSRDITSEAGENGLTLSDAERNNTIVLKAGAAEASLNGKAVALDAQCIPAGNGALLMPLSAFRTLFDADNKFVQEYSSAYIVESGLC